MQDNTHLITNATTLDGEAVDVLITNGVIESIKPTGTLAEETSVPKDQQTNAEERLLTPTFSETHIHLDATLTAGDPRWNERGTLTEGINIWGEYKQDLTPKDVLERAEQAVQWLAACGVTRIRTHADTTQKELATVKGLLELKDRVADLVDLEVVAFPQDGIFTAPENKELYEESLDLGVDLLGAIPHNEHTREDGVKSVHYVFDRAEDLDRPIDMHIDETDDDHSRFTEVLASEAIKRGLDGRGRVTASHTTAMHSYNNPYADKLISLLSRSGAGVSTQPLDNAVLQGRYDSYPRRRGHTRVDQLLDAGVPVAIGHDSVMDPWYHYGQGDPMDAMFVLLHYGHMSGWSDLDRLWTMITDHNATVWGADNYGLKEGCEGSIILFQEKSPYHALRQRQPRRMVLKEGRVIARSEPSSTSMYREGDQIDINFHPA